MKDAVRGINELSDAERQQCWSGLHDLQMKTVDARVKIQITADSFRAAADKLDQVWRDCKIAHAPGTAGGIISGCLALAGVTVVTVCHFASQELVMGKISNTKFSTHPQGGELYEMSMYSIFSYFLSITLCFKRSSACPDQKTVSKLPDFDLIS